MPGRHAAQPNANRKRDLGGRRLHLDPANAAKQIDQFNIPANMLKSSPNSPTSDTLTADYLGDPNYAQVVKPVTLTVVQSTFSLAASTPTSVSPGAQTTSTITVDSPSDYTGTVTFTSANCVLTGFPPAGVTARMSKSWARRRWRSESRSSELR